ncbi:hypothetical protein RRG08_014386 [Elysia crispata]|uniref:Uncharacterized protein n=1 Tax=Elysia crispata TaxID=231223 RepID=A0AAE1D1W0_9GAST|nr:hypothetical protein RRG08_014386 [Elysia crispata]
MCGVSFKPKSIRLAPTELQRSNQHPGIRLLQRVEKRLMRVSVGAQLLGSLEQRSHFHGPVVSDLESSIVRVGGINIVQWVVALK